MPEKQTIQRARKARNEGKRPTTQASEFVREEMHHMKEGKHGPESREQAIAIGLSKARRAGVDLGPPKAGQAKRKRAKASTPKRRRTATAAGRTGRAKSSRGTTTRRVTSRSKRPSTGRTTTRRSRSTSSRSRS
jgi:hypothetical protein